MRDIPGYITRLKSDFSELIERLESKFPYAEAFFSEKEGIYVGISRKETQIVSIPSRRGVVFSVFNGEYTVEMGTADFSRDSLNRTVRELMDSVPVAGRESIDPGEKWEENFFSSFREDPAEMSIDDKLLHLGTLRADAEALSPRIVSSFVRYAEEVTRKVYVNRNKSLFQHLLKTICVPVVILSDGKSSNSSRAGDGKLAGFEAARIPHSDLVEMVTEGEKMLGATPPTPGIYDIISGPGLSGVIAHEAFGHGVESDMFLKKRAKAVEFMDHPVASPLVTLIDSPAYPGLSGSYFFDDEGMRSSETVIIENGILRRALTDKQSARLLNLPRTANGRRESFANKVYTRMSNTYFQPGESSLEDMIASIEYGLFLPRGSNGMEDPKNWGIQAEALFAEEIKNGRLTGKVFAPVVITGFVPELLKSISMVGDTLGMEGIGTCQKGHKEQVPVAIGGPYLKMQARIG